MIKPTGGSLQFHHDLLSFFITIQKGKITRDNYEHEEIKALAGLSTFIM